ncbi:MAG: DUF4381 domain-containing protein [Granulosicoccus sp.]
MNDTEALLSQLRDIHAPEVGLMPAAGWWVLLLVSLLTAWLLRILLNRYRQRGWQREARAALIGLRKESANTSVPQSLASLSRLVRRVMLAARPREEVASLQGEAWLDKLDEICGKPLFKSGYGQLLEQGPYQQQVQLSHDDLHALMDVVAELIDAAGRQPIRTQSW